MLKIIKICFFITLLLSFPTMGYSLEKYITKKLNCVNNSEYNTDVELMYFTRTEEGGDFYNLNLTFIEKKPSNEEIDKIIKNCLNKIVKLDNSRKIVGNIYFRKNKKDHKDLDENVFIYNIMHYIGYNPIFEGIIIEKIVLTKKQDLPKWKYEEQFNNNTKILNLNYNNGINLNIGCQKNPNYNNGSEYFYYYINDINIKEVSFFNKNTYKNEPSFGKKAEEFINDLHYNQFIKIKYKDGNFVTIKLENVASSFKKLNCNINFLKEQKSFIFNFTQDKESPSKEKVEKKTKDDQRDDSAQVEALAFMSYIAIQEASEMPETLKINKIIQVKAKTATICLYGTNQNVFGITKPFIFVSYLDKNDKPQITGNYNTFKSKCSGKDIIRTINGYK